MLKKIYLTLVLFTLSGLAVIAQNTGSIQGKVVDKTTGEPLPFASVVADINGSQAGAGQTDIDGKYAIKPLAPGKYNLKVTFVGYGTVQINDVLVSTDKITFQDLKLTQGIDIKTVDITEFSVPLIDKGNPATQKTITAEEIQVAPTRDVKSLAATSAGVVQKDEGDDLNIRGARDNGTDYYVDGVKVRGNVKIPQSAIEQINIVTGGTAAQYGDNTGGIINITTKGPSGDFAGGIEYTTSEIFDKYGYNLVGANVSGPILSKKDANGEKSRPVLGFFLSGEYQLEKDPDPSAVGVYKVKDDKYNEVVANPLTPSPSGSGYVLSTNFINANDLEVVKAKLNTKLKSYSVVGKLDFQPVDKLTFTLGGNYQKSDQNIFTSANSLQTWLLNSDHNENRVETSWSAFARITQRFGSSDNKDKSASNIKNAYYSLQFETSSFKQIRQDAQHEDRLFDYGYIGKFQQLREKTYAVNTDPLSPLFGKEEQIGYSDLNYSFTPGDVNPILQNYTSQYYGLANNNVVNASQVTTNNSLINGLGPNSTYGIWQSPGTVFNLYNIRDEIAYRVSAVGSADIKAHNIMIGFEFEQRIDRGFGISPRGLWSVMQGLQNQFLVQRDLSDTLYTIGNDTAFYNTGYFHQESIDPNDPNSGLQQAPHNFYENIRDKLGLNYNDFVDVDSYDRSQFSLDLFTADDLIKNTNLSYFGYDYTGKKSSGSATFKDFFTEKDASGNYTRRIDAFRPIYMAGYIQDRFAINDLIFNVGVRVDRFDANQKVLKDKYLLFAAKTAGELNIPNRPGNIQDDFVVYVNDKSAPSENGVVGYRDGDTWYNALGEVIADPKVLADAAGGTIAPFLVDKKFATNGIQRADFDPDQSFTDYDPQINFMPRIAFQFPITDEAEFIAHYDVLTQRPQTRIRNTPITYYFLESTGLINNPNLKPEKTTDYEIGFKQKISSNSAISISAFYRELRNLIQLTNISYAFPVTYQTYGNIDFGTVKGLTFSYDLRRTQNVRITASYTLQFADGTGSADNTTNKVLAQPGGVNLRTLNPLDFDQRHIIVASVDYRYGSGKDYNGPMLFGTQFLQNTGINFVARINSGSPYSKQRDVTPDAGNLGLQTISSGLLSGSVNGARLPWQYRVDLKVDRDFELKFGGDAEKKKSAFINVYVQIQNVFNTKNIIKVYRYTGNPDDDGYLASAVGQQAINQQVDSQSYIDLYNASVVNPDNYSLPRRVRVGVKLDF